MNRSVFFALFIVTGIAVGCTSDSSHTKSTDSTANIKPVAPVVKVSFQDESTNTVYQHYMQLKNFLVGSDARQAQAAAAKLEQALKASGNEKGAESAKTIAGSDDLAKQRSLFNGLTTIVENAFRAGDLSSGTIYKQYCPMANDGNGGYWLSGESTIRNPYYGDDMLECGEVKEEIK